MIQNKANVMILPFSKMHYSIFIQHILSYRSFIWDTPFITMVKVLFTSYSDALFSTINQSIPIPNLNLLCLINHTILWFTSLLCSIKYNTHHSQYPMLLPVMLLFTFIPILHFISLNQLISPIGPDVNQSNTSLPSIMEWIILE